MSLLNNADMNNKDSHNVNDNMDVNKQERDDKHAVGDDRHNVLHQQS